MGTRRQRKAANLMQEEISEIVTRKLRDPRVAGVTVTEVRVSPDLRYADVYVTKLGDEEERKAALAGLTAAAGYLRHELGTRVDLRFLPELRFHLDEAWERGARIEALLEELATQNDTPETTEKE